MNCKFILASANPRDTLASVNAETALVAPEKTDAPPMKQLAPFDSFKEQIEKLKSTAETLTVTDVNDKAGMKLARATRLALREVRIAVEDRRKELGEHHLRETQRINSDARAIKSLIEPLELRLADQEQFAEREAARIGEEKRVERTALLLPYGTDASLFNLAAMSPEVFETTLEGIKAAYQAKIDRDLKEKTEAEARANAEAERIEAQRVENERLKAEAAEREDLAKKEREEVAERFRLADEKAKADAAEAKEKEEALNTRMLADAQARDRAESELAAKKAAEQKAADEKLAAEKKAAAAPDKSKLAMLAETIRLLTIPPLLNTELSTLIAGQREKFAAWIEKKADEL